MSPHAPGDPAHSGVVTRHAHAHRQLREVRRLLRRNLLLTSLVVIGSLALGAAGYHFLGELPWIDATLNAAMILTGMGPLDRLPSDAGKLFAIGYALFSGVAFLSVVALLLVPLFRHTLHRFHLDVDEN